MQPVCVFWFTLLTETRIGTGVIPELGLVNDESNVSGNDTTGANPKWPERRFSGRIVFQKEAI